MNPHPWDTLSNRLKGHFNRVTFHPPDEAALAHLNSLIAGIPMELKQFYTICNGLRVEMNDCVQGEIFGIQTLLDVHAGVMASGANFLTPEETAERKRFLPLRQDGCGNYDCVVTEPGIGENAVIFWDHETVEGPEYLLGGSLWSYLEMWSDRLIHQYLPNGNRDARYIPPRTKSYPYIGKPESSHPWPFEEAWMRRRDPVADELLAASSIRKWLHAQGE